MLCPKANVPTGRAHKVEPYTVQCRMPCNNFIYHIILYHVTVVEEVDVLKGAAGIACKKTLKIFKNNFNITTINLTKNIQNVIIIIMHWLKYHNGIFFMVYLF